MSAAPQATGYPERGMSGPTIFNNFRFYCRGSYGYDALASNFLTALYGIDNIHFFSFSSGIQRKARWATEVSVTISLMKDSLRIKRAENLIELFLDIVTG